MLGHKVRKFKPLTAFCLEDLVPADHFYRQVERSIDLSFVSDLADEFSVLFPRVPWQSRDLPTNRSLSQSPSQTESVGWASVWWSERVSPFEAISLATVRQSERRRRDGGNRAKSETIDPASSWKLLFVSQHPFFPFAFPLILAFSTGCILVRRSLA